MGYFDEYLLPDVKLPNVSKHLERQIGAFFVAWAVLENELDIAYPVFFRVDPTLAVSLYANAGTQAKIDTLMSAIDAHQFIIGKREVESAHKIMLRVRTLNERARNTLAHVRLLQFFNEEKRLSEWRMVRYAARSQQSWVMHPHEVKHWRRLTKGVVTAAKAWHRKMRTLHEKLKKYSDDEIAENLVVHEKDAQLIQFRKSPSSKKAGSPSPRR